MLCAAWFPPFDSFVPFEFTDSIPGPGGRVYSDNELVEKVLEARVNAVLKESAHRPWPMPAGPWVMAQSWHDLLFAHWQVDRTVLRSQDRKSTRLNSSHITISYAVFCLKKK